MKLVIVIQGPTASGKTALAIELAKSLNSIVLSADSRQFYKEMSIGTAKPSSIEMDDVPHFFIDSHSIHQPLTSAQYAKEAELILREQFKYHDAIILVGGSGMFIDALCRGIDDIPQDEEIRNELTRQFETDGLVSLLHELEMVDHTYFQQVDQSNAMRIIRALEVFRLTGIPYSTFRKNEKQQTFFKSIFFTIDLPRESLYQRINLRVDEMMRQGLLEEVKSLYQFKDLQAMNTVGYKELIQFLDGELDLNEAIDKIKMHTRRYAKRQLTWFRRHEDTIWLKSQELDSQKLEILTKLKNESLIG